VGAEEERAAVLDDEVLVRYFSRFSGVLYRVFSSLKCAFFGV